MKKHAFKASLYLNAVFIILFLALGFRFKEKIIQKILDTKEKATIVSNSDFIDEAVNQLITREV